MIPVEVLTAESCIESVGDRASMLGTVAALARRGVPTIPVAEPSGSTVVIGGGAILGQGEHLSHFRVHGQHILNAVQAYPGPDYSYLSGYRMISVRDAKSEAVIGRASSIVPCPATVLSPSGVHRRIAQRSSGMVIVHRDPICESVIRKHTNHMLVVDAQSVRKVDWGIGGTIAPPISSPEMLIATIEGAAAVVSRSLHLGILSLVAGVPFACIDCGNDSQSEKMREYWKSRGMPGVMYDGDDPIGHASSLGYNWADLLNKQRCELRDHFDRMAAALASWRNGHLHSPS